MSCSRGSLIRACAQHQPGLARPRIHHRSGLSAGCAHRMAPEFSEGKRFKPAILNTCHGDAKAHPLPFPDVPTVVSPDAAAPRAEGLPQRLDPRVDKGESTATPLRPLGEATQGQNHPTVSVCRRQSRRRRSPADPSVGPLTERHGSHERRHLQRRLDVLLVLRGVAHVSREALLRRPARPPPRGPRQPEPAAHPSSSATKISNHPPTPHPAKAPWAAARSRRAIQAGTTATGVP
jgi:hypothetical protein